MSEELWGPWIEHDGKGCPCVGSWIQAQFDMPPMASHGTTLGVFWEGRATGATGWVRGAWWCNVIRYRIRKPRGLTILEELLENLPAPTSPKVDA